MYAAAAAHHRVPLFENRAYGYSVLPNPERDRVQFVFHYGTGQFPFHARSATMYVTEKALVTMSRSRVAKLELQTRGNGCSLLGNLLLKTRSLIPTSGARVRHFQATAGYGRGLEESF
jgi:hypothetical protein